MSSNQIHESWWNGSDPADEKAWSASYKEAEQQIRTSALWQSAFSTIVQSFQAIQGAQGIQVDKLRAMEEVYRGMDSLTAKRSKLQKLVHEVLERPRDEWPDYADVVWYAVTTPRHTASSLGALEGNVGADSLTQATLQATLLLIAGFLEKVLPAKLGDQWWDPKYPTAGGSWDTGFDAINVLFQSAPAWKQAIVTFFQELPAATLQAAQDCYENEINIWDQRLQLWNVVRDQVFGAHPDKWPKHVGVVMSVVSEDMKMAPGHAYEFPQGSSGKPLRIVTFKVAILFIAGLCENKLSFLRSGL